MKRAAILLFLFLTVLNISFSQINPDSVNISSKEIAPGLFQYKLYGCNILALKGNDGILVVDACYDELGDKLYAEITKKENLSVKYLINTHWHFDHIGGNHSFVKDAVIIAHDSTRKYLSEDRFLLGETIKALPEEMRPDMSFSDRMTIYFNNDSVELIAMPGGHTGGDIIVYFKRAGVLHIGDIVFSDMFPFCDVKHGGNVIKIAENIRKITASFPSSTRIITGHGREYSMKDLEEYANMVTSTYVIVVKEIKKKKSLQQIKDADVLKEWKEWGLAFTCSDWIGMIYDSCK